MTMRIIVTPNALRLTVKRGAPEKLKGEGRVHFGEMRRSCI